MENENSGKCNKKWKRMSGNSTPGPVYGLGFIGALVYYLSHTTSLWLGFVGIFKAILWPAFLLFKVLELLKM